MGNNENERSGLQTAANLARATRSAANIARAAASSGVYGAAAAAAQEAAPLLIKVALCLIIAMIIIPMVVFTALPNFFFGFGTTGVEAITKMNEQAKLVGGVYMSLEDFEKTEIDSIVTGIANEYEENGTAIDEIQIDSSFGEDDLIWLIAINSVAHQQDLEDMSTEDIREMCSARMSYTPSLLSDASNTLTVTVSKLDAEAWMDRLGFDEKAKNWAGVIHETLSESGALETYGSYFSAYTPSYSGDTGYTGGVQHGSGYGNDIDTSQFQNPYVKNGHDMAEYAKQAWENNWGYVWGTFGNVLTQSLLNYKAQQYPDGVGNLKSFIAANYLNRRTADCIGLVKSYCWFNPTTGKIDYATNNIPDYSANQMYQWAKNRGMENGTMANLPEVPGLVLWKQGHAGIYIGGGYAIEAMSTRKGVGKTAIAGRGWQAWYKLPGIQYDS